MTDDRRTTTARKADTAAEAVDAATERPDPDHPQAQTADQISAGLQQIAGMLRHTDFDRVAGAVTRFARENPALFLGGAALAGFAATRFLKASASDPAPADPNDIDPWSGHLDASAPHPEPEPGLPFGGSRASPQTGNRNGRASS